VKTVLLNSEQHRDLRVDTSYRPEYGDAVMWSQTFAAEFLSVQAHYPILFQKDPASGQFRSLALFGVEQGENLFLQDGQWDAGYIPLMMQRVPFSIGRYEQEGGSEAQRMLHIDIEHPKVNSDKGQRLFESNGSKTLYLERVSGMLEAIHHWVNHDAAFVQALEAHQLLETVTMDITLADGTKGQLLGFHTINEDRVNALSAEQVASLHQQGFLQPIYMVLASMPNMRRLVERKSRQNRMSALEA